MIQLWKKNNFWINEKLLENFEVHMSEIEVVASSGPRRFSLNKEVLIPEIGICKFSLY